MCTSALLCALASHILRSETAKPDRWELETIQGEFRESIQIRVLYVQEIGDWQLAVFKLLLPAERERD